MQSVVAVGLTKIVVASVVEGSASAEEGKIKVNQEPGKEDQEAEDILKGFCE